MYHFNTFIPNEMYYLIHLIHHKTAKPLKMNYLTPKEIREKLKLTQGELAKKTGLSRATIARHENNGNIPESKLKLYNSLLQNDTENNTEEPRQEYTTTNPNKLEFSSPEDIIIHQIKNIKDFMDSPFLPLLGKLIFDQTKADGLRDDIKKALEDHKKIIKQDTDK